VAITSEMWELWKSIKLNHKRLDECSGPHDFIGDETEAWSETKDGGRLYKRYVCTKCNGKITSHDWRWYTRGLEHGRILK